MTISLCALLRAMAALVALSVTASAHEGHLHEDEAPAPIVAASLRGVGQSAVFEVVAIARSGEIIFYIDRFATNEPVPTAQVEVDTPVGPVRAAARPDATFAVPAPWLKPSVPSDLVVTIAAADEVDVVALTIPAAVPDATAISAQAGTGLRARDLAFLTAGLLAGVFLVVVTAVLNRRRQTAVIAVLAVAVGGCFLAINTAQSHEGHDHGDTGPTLPLSGDLSRRLPNGSIFVPKPAQRLFGVRTTITETGAHRQAVELPGRVIPDPNASGHVQSIVGGRISAPAGGFPRLGARVKVGDVLAYVTPPLQAIDLSDMRQRQSELDQQIAIAERKLARSVALAQSGTLAKAQYEDTLSELEGLRQRRAFLDVSRREAEHLVAPVDGIIADGTPIAGQVAQPNALVFQIIDPARLWVEALSFDALAPSGPAMARSADGTTYRLSPRGAGFADRSQAVPLHFAIEGETGGLRAGQFVSVTVATRSERNGIALPRASVVRASNGQSVVYVHTAAEVFEPRAVKVEPLDGGRLLVTAGLTAGQRVVVQAAELIDQVR